MDMNPLKPVMRFGALFVLLCHAPWTTAAPKPTSPPPSHDHAAQVTVANNVGDSILGDGGVYTDGIDGTEARIWDFGSPFADHLHFAVNSTSRSLTLVIDELGLNVRCRVGTLKPNESLIGFQFYNDPGFPVGDSTSGPENYGGSFKCTTDKPAKTGWFIHWKPADECIVISHPASSTYTFTAGAGCPADISQIINGTVQQPLGAYDVPFQVHATVLP